MFIKRLEKLRERLLQKKLDGFLVSNFFNILYLTSFKTLTTDEREAFVLVTEKNCYLFTDERYASRDKNIVVENLTLQTKLIEPGKGLITHLQEIVDKERLKTLGFEAEDISYFEYQNLKSKLVIVSWQPTTQLVVQIRGVKDEKEIEEIAKACQIGDDCLVEVSHEVKTGMSEKEIAFKMEMYLKSRGFDWGFDPIVAIDANSALPHYNTKAGHGIVKKDSVILLDYGIKYHDYLSDITRMIFMKETPREIIKIYHQLNDAQIKTVDMIKEINKLSEVDLYCRNLLVDNKLPSYPHSTGHGVGLEIHEYPKVSFNSTEVKKDGQILTVEPGVYFPGKWGMRVEDTVVIQEGMAKSLTKFPKSLLIV